MNRNGMQAARAILEAPSGFGAQSACAIAQRMAVLMDGIASNRGKSVGLLISLAAWLGREQAGGGDADLASAIEDVDRIVAYVEDSAQIMSGGASACAARWEKAGSFELVRVGTGNAAVAGGGAARFLFGMPEGESPRLGTYLGSNRCDSETVQRYNLVPTEEERSLVLMSREVWQRLPLGVIANLCQCHEGHPQRTADALVAAASDRGCRQAAAVVAIQLQ